MGGPFTFEGCSECTPGGQGATKPSLRSGPAGERGHKGVFTLLALSLRFLAPGA